MSEASQPASQPVGKPTILDRSAILAGRRPLLPEEVTLPGLAGLVHVRRLTVGQIDQYQDAVRKCDPGHVRGTILAHALCDQAGAPLFNDSDVPALSELDGGEYERAVDKFLDLNGIARKN